MNVPTPTSGSGFATSESAHEAGKHFWPDHAIRTWSIPGKGYQWLRLFPPTTPGEEDPHHPQAVADILMEGHLSCSCDNLEPWAGRCRLHG